ncbi:hypothetical protein K2X30_02040 [bacterium]|jgi:hypothetical protein|nr:hypothetical protein [bacterium]
MNYDSELEQSLRYLKSDQALKALSNDCYWPKWNSPWWQMLLLHEMDLAREIPGKTLSAYIESLNRMPLKIFPIHPGELPEGVDPFRGTPCHCQLGNVYQVLASAGVDVDQELPWIRPWFLRYQMADGGLNCDNDAYLVKDETPSSMVGTIAAFEAILLHTHRPWTQEESAFLQKGAEFLIGRQLKRGSSTRHNADEREDEIDWLKPCFPRFYFYDVLRGLNAVLNWAEKTKSKIPHAAIQDVVQDLDRRFPDGEIRIERNAFRDSTTILLSSTGEWIRRQPAVFFPLLQRVSEVGEVSPFLSKRWGEATKTLSVINPRFTSLTGL